MDETKDILIAQAAAAPAQPPPANPPAMSEKMPAQAQGTLANTGTQSAGGQPSGQQQMPPFWANPMFVMIILLGGMFWWMNRQQKKQKQERQKLMDSVKTGDRIVTSSGIHGVVANVKEKTLIVKIAENVKIELNRSAVDVLESRALDNSGASDAAPKDSLVKK